MPLQKAFLAPIDFFLPFTLVRRLGPSPVVIISTFHIHTDKAPLLYTIRLPLAVSGSLMVLRGIKQADLQTPGRTLAQQGSEFQYSDI